MTRGQPRQANAKFFDQAWLQFVLSTPHGRVIEVKSDHWMHLKAPRVSNEAIVLLDLAFDFSGISFNSRALLYARL